MQHNSPQKNLAQLFERYLKASDLAALESLFDQLAPKLSRVAKRINRDEHDAADAVQETFIELLEQRGAFDPTRPFLPWVIGILIHKSKAVTQSHARAERAKQPEIATERQPNPRPEESLARTELESSIHAALDDLPPSMRAVVTARMLEGEPGPSIAKQHRMTESALRSRLHRGKLLLQRALAPAATTWFGASFLGWLGAPLGLPAIKRDFMQAATRSLGTAGKSSTASLPGRSLVPKLALGAAALVAALSIKSAIDHEPATQVPITQSVLAASNTKQPPTIPAPVAQVPTNPRQAVEAGQKFDEVTAQVHWLASGEPISGHPVTLATSPRETPALFHATTDAAGTARFKVPAGVLLIQIAANSTATTTRSSNYLMAPLSEFTQLLHERLTLAVGTGGSLTGQVLDNEENPVPFAEVNAWNNRYKKGEPGRTVRADGQGRFTLLNLGPDYVATASTDSLVCYEGLRGKVPEGAQYEGAVLRLIAPVTRSGFVVDPNGLPVEAAKVVFRNGIYTSSTSQVTSISGTSYFTAGSGEATTAADGSFQVKDLPPGQTGFTVSRYPFKNRSARYKRSSDNSPLTVTLQAGQQIAGVVLDSNGKPLEGAIVRPFPIRVEVDESRLKPTDRSGHFEIAGLDYPQESSKQFGLFVLHKNHALLFDQSITTDTSNVVLRLKPERPLSGNIVDQNGQPLVDYKLRIEGDGRIQRSFSTGDIQTPEWAVDIDETKTDLNGHFSFQHLNRGPYKLHILHPQHSKASVTKLIDFDQEVLDVVVELAEFRKVALTGTVVDALTKAPVQNAAISIRIGDSRRSSVFGKTDLDGHFEIIGLEANQLEVMVAATGYPRISVASRHFEVGDHELAIELWPTRSITIETFEADGSPTLEATATGMTEEGIELLFSVGEGTTIGGITTYNGILNLHGLPARPVTLQISSQDQIIELPIDLTTPIEEPIRITFPPVPDSEPAPQKDSALLAWLLMEATPPFTVKELEGHYDPAKGTGDMQWLTKQYESRRLRPVQGYLEVQTFAPDGKLFATTTFKPTGEPGPDRLFKIDTSFPGGKISPQTSTIDVPETLPMAGSLLEVPPGEYCLEITSDQYKPATRWFTGFPQTQESGTPNIVILERK